MMLSAPIVGKLYRISNQGGHILEVRLMVSSPDGRYHMVRVPRMMPFVIMTNQFIGPVRKTP